MRWLASRVQPGYNDAGRNGLVLYGKSWYRHGIFNLDSVSLQRLPEARGKRLAQILVEFHHGVDSILDVRQCLF